MLQHTDEQVDTCSTFEQNHRNMTRDSTAPMNILSPLLRPDTDTYALSKLYRPRWEPD